MATSSSYRKAALVGAAALVLALGGGNSTRPAWLAGLDADESDLVGFAGHVADSTNPKVTAFFPNESYKPGTIARLHVADSADGLRIQIFRAGTSFHRIPVNDVITGRPVTPGWSVGRVDGARTIPVRLGNWPSGGWERADTILSYRATLLRGISVGHFLRRASGSNA